MKVHATRCGQVMLYLQRGSFWAFCRAFARSLVLFAIALLLQTSANLAAAEKNPVYFLREGFDGSGFEDSGWLKFGSPNEDFTNTVLHGSQSLYCSDTQFISHSFQRTNQFNLYFRARWNRWGDFNNVIFWYDSTFVITARITINPLNGILTVHHGSVNTKSTMPVKLNTTYHMWVEWTRGEGANGTMLVYFSTDGIKPASPAASIATGNGRATDSISIGSTTPGQQAIYDRILASDAPIGDAPTPTVSAIADQTILQDTTSDPIPFIVDEFDTRADTLAVSGSSSNPSLVPDENIVFGGSDSNRTVTIIPASGESGTAVISIVASDGSLTGTNTFSMTVTGNSKPTLAITANSTTRAYGSANPDLTGTISGLQEGDDITASYSTTANQSSGIGSYPITIALNDPQGKLINYTVVAREGTLDVTSARLTVRADNHERPYGAANPPLTGSVSGLQNSDDIQAGYSTTANQSSAIGSYSITIALSDPDGKLINYTVIAQEGTLNVTPAPLTVSADNQVRLYGAPNPLLTGSISGLQNSDDIQASYSTIATQSSLVGNYPISISLTDPESALTNYTVTVHEGALQVAAAPLTINIDNQERFYGATNPPLTGSITGLENGDDIAGTYTTVATPASPVGHYSIFCKLDDPDSKLTNYIVTTNLGTLRVLPTGLTSIEFTENTSRLSGTGEPGLSYTIEASSDLSEWHEIGTVTADADGLLEFEDSDAPNFTVRFYRAVAKAGS